MTSFVDTDHDAMAEIRATYPIIPVLATEYFVADLTRGTLLDREVDSTAEVDAYASACLDADDGGFFAAAVRARALFAAMCGVLGATDAPADDDFDEHGNGGLLVPWPADCAGLNGLSAALYQEPGR